VLSFIATKLNRNPFALRYRRARPGLRYLSPNGTGDVLRFIATKLSKNPFTLTWLFRPS
jgi:hypothetical protein